MNRIVVLIISYIVLSFSCYGREIKGKGNPNIGKVIRIEYSKITSLQQGDEIIPSYEICLKRIKNVTVEEIRFNFDFIFGQNLDLLYTKEYILLKDSDEVMMLNTENECIITGILKPIKKEKDIITPSYGLLNEQRISIMLSYLKYK